MSDPSAKITDRCIDTHVAVVAADPTGLALFGARKDPVTDEKGRARS
jgi:hypothetical protein